MKTYKAIPIRECGEEMQEIPGGRFAFYSPHPYVVLGAPYGVLNPWRLRHGVVAALEKSADALDELKPGWRILLFDTWRPNSVQNFMVEREYRLCAVRHGIDPDAMTREDRKRLESEVLRIWAVPSDDPATPPPHSTGGVVDCTLADADGREVGMGSPIDENSDRSNPDYFSRANDENSRAFDINRELLRKVMLAGGFLRHPTEWWHFSIGDQMWAWQQRQITGDDSIVARYGGAT